MGAKTGISWTSSTWNPIRGCSRVSKGCEHCYAETVAARFSGPGAPYEGLITLGAKGPRWNGKIAFIPDVLTQPLRWSKPRKIFVNSMSDLFHANVKDDDLISIFAVMALAQQHTFQVLTKRADRMRALMEQSETYKRFGIATFVEAVALEAERIGRITWDSRGSDPVNYGSGLGGIGVPKNLKSRRVWPGWPLPNVWLGVSAEDQAAADERIPHLLKTKAAKLFVSYEPAIGPVTLHESWLHGAFDHCPEDAEPDGCAGCRGYNDHGYDGDCNAVRTGSTLDWIIVGGESGPGARSFDIEWARSIIEQAKGSKCRVFVKQLGARPLGLRSGICDRCAFGHATGAHGLDCPKTRVLEDRKGGDMAEWPADLRVQEYPT